MILCAGLTPAWQQILEFEKFHHGQVNRAAGVHWCASGKSLNVAAALGSLGIDCCSLTSSGGTQGAMLEQEFAERGVAAEWIHTAAATRVCTTIVERTSGATTELVENAQPINAAEWQSFLDRYARLVGDASVVVLTGSLPPGAPRDCYAQLMARTQVPVVLDARGPELLEALPKRPFVVKPNREELGHTVNGPIETDEELLAAMRRLNELGAHWVIVSNGPQTVWATSTDQLLRCRPPVVKPVNAIGCGDCLSAGVAWGIYEGRGFDEALRLGIACAVENALQLLPARLERAKVLARFEQLTIEQY